MNLLKLQGRQAKPFACVLLVGLSLLLSVTSHSQTYVGPIPNTDLKHGRVMARSIVVDPATGEPILVEYNADGTEAGEVDIGGASVADVSILPAADYRFYQTQLAGYQEQYKDTLALGAEVYWRTKFSQAVFVAADGQTVITQEVLPEGVNSVLVRGQSNRLLPDPAQLVLLSFPLDMSQDIAVSDNSVSLVVDINGRILAQSENNIGYRTGFFGDPNDPQDDRGSQVGEDDTVFGPIQGVKVSVDEFAYRGGADVTNSEGAYSFLFYMPPCLVGGFSFTTDVWAELRYKNFLPGGSPSIPYYLRTPSYSDCYASLYPGFGGSVPAPNTFSNFQSNLYADVMFVTGRIKLRALDGSEIEVGDTTYTAFETPANATTQNHYDFNGDGRSDFVVRGRVDTQTNDEGDEVDVFIADQDNGDLQGIFFDGSQEDEFDLPDLVRLIDTELRNEPIGVLKSISSADLRNTDVLFFRESTGQLIMERRGLKEEESEYRRAVQYDDEKNEVAYRIMLRGPSDSALNVGGGVRRDASYTEWATQNQLTEPFLKKLSDSPRPGEFIKIVAINRATGYTGTQRVQLLSAGDNSTGQLDVAVEPITLAPPNLKIWAERNYEVEHGLTKGEDRTYTIGSEGAALTSDKTITIYTEWLDEAGAPLPDELSLDDGEQYGLTGRLAKVVTTNTLQGVGAGSDLAEFPIAGGRKTQVIKVGDNLTTAQHFYIHVHGKPKDQECVSGSSCPDFSMGSDEPGFEGRPQLITPFLTPLGDEDKHWQEYNAYRDLQREAEDDPDAIEPIRPLPAYAWQYRPEYQFSQFDLEIDELNRTTTDEDGVQTNEDILANEFPTLFTGDDLLSVFYSLILSNFDRLTPIDGTQEIVLALGEQEAMITIGEDQTITFDNVENLGSLDPEDFLTIRLYTNNDAGNILWEYAFYAIGMAVDNNRDGSVNTASESDTDSSQPTTPSDEDDDDNSPTNPFLFWINNDYDVVNNAGRIQDNKTQCPPEEEPEEQQCEQWDEVADDNNNNNSLGGNNFQRIESQRDLEDFQALYLEVPFALNEQGVPKLPEDVHFSLRANNININLFHGVWERGNDFMTDADVMKNQVEEFYDINGDGKLESMRLFRVGEDTHFGGGIEIVFDQEMMNRVFKRGNGAKLIFESYKASPLSCVEQPEECYLQASFKRGGQVLASQKLYMQFYDVRHFYDHYSVGTGETPDDGTEIVPDQLLFPLARNLHDSDDPHQFININQGKDGGFEDEYIMMVHGWRMRYPERVHFGETAFKRLFLSGYKGRFGLFSWPTGWFERESHVYSVIPQLIGIFGHQQNYGNSEFVARVSGAKLANLLSTSVFTAKNVNIFAHSMGNVVVSEALRVAGGNQIADNYVASQAAESASAYNPDEQVMKFFKFPQSPAGIEIAWHLANALEDSGNQAALITKILGTPGPLYLLGAVLLNSEYDMPPDQYRFRVPEIHGATSPRFDKQEALQEGWGENYYNRIDSSVAGEIINFYNPSDAALESWKINQMTKPDLADGPTYEYGFELFCSEEELICDPTPPDIEDDERVTDVYRKGGQQLEWNYSSAIPIDEANFEVLAHITPSRSAPLGQVRATSENEKSVIDASTEFSYGRANQGHSAQYYSTYGARSDYWVLLLTDGFGFLEEQLK